MNEYFFYEPFCKYFRIFYNFIIMRKTRSFVARIIIFAFISSTVLIVAGFTSPSGEAVNEPIFTCMVNDKPFILENLKATMRNTTGGRKQVSLSNDRFVKFFFINPEIKTFDLSKKEAKQAIIRYSEPGTNLIYVPRSGNVTIKELDVNSKTISGTFEMELVLPGKDKVIRVTRGEFKAPIVIVR